MTVYISSPSSCTMRKEIQQLSESFSLHCLLTPVDLSSTRMLGQAWEQFFWKGPLRKALHSTQELQNRRPELTSAGAEDLSPGFDCAWALPKHRQDLPAPAQEVGRIPAVLPAVSARITHMYLPQGEGQPGHSWQKGGWYPSWHWQRLQWQVPRWLHSLPRMFKQPSVDFLHWQALPWYPAVHLHSPQSHFPRSVGEDLLDQDPTESQVALPLPVLGEHHPPCALHAALLGMAEEVLQAGAVGPRTPKPTHLGFGRERQHLPGDLIFLNSARVENPSHRSITCAAAGEAVVKLAVHVVALAEGAVDLLVGHVAGVADALPAHAVPQPRADDRAVVLPAAALQLLAGLAFGFALAVLPCVA